MEIYIKDERERANAEERKKLFAAGSQKDPAKVAAAASKGAAGKASGKSSPNPKAKAAGSLWHVIITMQT